MPNLTLPIAVAGSTFAVEKFIRKKETETSAVKAGISGGSAFAVNELFSIAPTVSNAFASLSETYGEMLASALLTTLACRLYEGKSVVEFDKKMIKSYLINLGEQGIGSYLESPIEPYLPAMLK